MSPLPFSLIVSIIMRNSTEEAWDFRLRTFLEVLSLRPSLSALLFTADEVTKCYKAEKDSTRLQGSCDWIGNTKQAATTERSFVKHNKSSSYCLWESCIHCSLSRLLGPDGSGKINQVSFYGFASKLCQNQEFILSDFTFFNLKFLIIGTGCSKLHGEQEREQVMV